MLVIADAARPVALAGVMGGRDSEVSDRTINVLLESARFDPLSVRKTARALDLRSDSSYRFERGIDPTLPERASRRAAQLILQIAGGELLSGVVEAGGRRGWRPKRSRCAWRSCSRCSASSCRRPGGGRAAPAAAVARARRATASTSPSPATGST